MLPQLISSSATTTTKASPRAADTSRGEGGTSPLVASVQEGNDGGPPSSISAVELEALKGVFSAFDKDVDGKITWMDISEILKILGVPRQRKEIELMIWEVDENLDGVVSWKEFLSLYTRCISDKHGLEPRRFFHLVQFLMYDRDVTGRITEEQTLQILFVRHGRENLDKEIQAMFGENDSTSVNDEPQERQLTFPEFLKREEARLKDLRATHRGISYPSGCLTAAASSKRKPKY